MPALAVWAVLLALGAAAGTWLARRYALRGNLLDQPGDRRSHTVATPRGGGIAIVAMLAVAGLYLVLRSPSAGLMMPAFLVGLVLVAGIGWWDDHRPLSPWFRLIVQAVAAVLLAGAAWSDGGGMVMALCAFASALVLVNVWNFMDGINGLAAGQAAVAALAYALVLPGDWAWLAVALLAACAGFLPFNFPRARIFMGDVGSGALGFTLATLFVSGYPAAKVPWPLLALPLCGFLVDAGFTLAERMLRGERWWTPHVSHLYQRAARQVGHASTTLIYVLFGGVTLLLMYVLSRLSWGAASVAVAGVYAGTWLVWLFLRRGLRG